MSPAAAPCAISTQAKAAPETDRLAAPTPQPTGDLSRLTRPIRVALDGPGVKAEEELGSVAISGMGMVEQVDIISAPGVHAPAAAVPVPAARVEEEEPGMLAVSG
jgi:hypothetical protein